MLLFAGMAKSKILITGGAGFIGSNLADRLLEACSSVVCYDNFDSFYSRSVKEKNISQAIKSASYKLVEGDLLDPEKLVSTIVGNEIDTIVHLAAKAGVRPSIQDPGAYFKTNLEGTLNVLNAMNKSGVKKLVFASSSSIYGNNEKIPYSESDRVDNPISPYAASKKSAELLTYTFHHMYKFNVINLRFFTVFGPRQRPDLAIHKFFHSIYKGTPIDFYGDGTTSRDYTYIDDITSGIISAMDHLNSGENIYETINLGNNSPVTLSELISTIEDVAGKKFLINKLPMQVGDMIITYADIEKAKRILNYDPQISLKAGLIKFKDWYEVQ